MRNDDLMSALSDAVDALAAGDELARILARYEPLRLELQPMLEAAAAARDYARPHHVPAHAQRADRTQFLARAAAQRNRRAARGAGLFGLRAWAAAHRAMAAAAAVILVLALGSYGTAVVSANSLPGEPLYGIKRTVEQAQLLVALDPAARTQLEDQFAARRIDEVEQLLRAGRSADVSFGGTIEALADGQWTVAGISVTIGGDTEVVGTPAVGLHAQIEGLAQTDGAVMARRVAVTSDDLGREEPAPTLLPTATTPAPTVTTAPQATVTAQAPLSTAQPGEMRFSGVVEAIGPNQWIIAGQKVAVTGATEIRDNPQVGQTVEVRASRAGDGSLTALRIERAEDGPEDELSETPANSTPATPSSTAQSTDDDSGPGSEDDDGDDSSGPGSDEDDIGDDNSGPGSDDDAGDDEEGGDDQSGPSPSNTPQPEETDEPDDEGEEDGEEVRWEGLLESRNGSVWVVGGQSVIVTGDTEVDDDLEVGDLVEVRARRQGDGSLEAERIERR